MPLAINRYLIYSLPAGGRGARDIIPAFLSGEHLFSPLRMKFFSKWEENFTAKPRSTPRKSLFLGFEKPERIFSVPSRP
jgi:hypothetical protein